MAELAQQHDLAGIWDDTPIDTALTHIGLLVTAGEDAMLSFAQLIVANHTPLYTFQPVARFGLECLALAHWLCEPGIGARERVRRSLNERLASAYEQTRLPEGMNPEPQRNERLLAATALGFKVHSRKGRLSVLGQERPTITRHVQDVLGHDRLGKVMYSFTSAVSHGTLWGLVESLQPPHGTPREPVVTVPLVISSDRIANAALALTYAHMRSYDRLINYLGWPNEAWADAYSTTLAEINHHLVGRRK